jgi:hypothetical protein
MPWSKPDRERLRLAGLRQRRFIHVQHAPFDLGRLRAGARKLNSEGQLNQLSLEMHSRVLSNPAGPLQSMTQRLDGLCQFDSGGGSWSPRR